MGMDVSTRAQLSEMRAKFTIFAVSIAICCVLVLETYHLFLHVFSVPHGVSFSFPIFELR